jgi:glutathione S-transferase
MAPHPRTQGTLRLRLRRGDRAQYQLFYWSEIQGRGEFVRLALEEAGAPYVDLARLPESKGGGDRAILRVLRGDLGPHLPFAAPILKAGRIVVAQTAAILQFLAPRHGLVPEDAAAQLWAHQLQLTIADLLVEVHDTHHPIAVDLYYEDQRKEAKRRTDAFRRERLPLFLGYFERVLVKNGGRHPVSGRFSYIDLSLFQLLEGLEYAFPRALGALRRRIPKLEALRERVRERPRIAAYLVSPRRIPFNTWGIFRHYPELDAPR